MKKMLPKVLICMQEMLVFTTESFYLNQIEHHFIESGRI